MMRGEEDDGGKTREGEKEVGEEGEKKRGG